MRILVTNECPAKCVGCHNEYQEDTMSRNKFVSVSVIDELLHNLKSVNCLPNEVILSGGEPSLFNDLPKLAQVIHNAGIPYISLNSNCVDWNNIILTLDWINEIKVHIEDLPHKKNLNGYTQSIGLSSRVLENIKTIPSLLKQGQKAYINTIMRSEEQVKRIIDFSIKYGFNTKVIEESLVTTDRISYSKNECINYLLSSNYFLIKENSCSSQVFQLQGSNHKVYLRQCITCKEPFVTLNNNHQLTIVSNYNNLLQQHTYTISELSF